MKAVSFTNKKAHELLTAFHNMCDVFNDGGFSDHVDNKVMLNIYLSEANDCFDLVQYLRAMDDCEATNAYVDFARRIMLRLSSLIHNGRKETLAERVEHFCR
jgi:hypothetical protein